MKGYTVHQILEAEAKTRSLRDAATSSLNSFDLVAHCTELTDEQTEMREDIMGDRDTYLLTLTLLGEEIDRLDSESSTGPSSP